MTVARLRRPREYRAGRAEQVERAAAASSFSPIKSPGSRGPCGDVDTRRVSKSCGLANSTASSLSRQSAGRHLHRASSLLDLRADLIPQQRPRAPATLRGHPTTAAERAAGLWTCRAPRGIGPVRRIRAARQGPQALALEREAPRRGSRRTGGRGRKLHVHRRRLPAAGRGSGARGGHLSGIVAHGICAEPRPSPNIDSRRLCRRRITDNDHDCDCTNGLRVDRDVTNLERVP